MLFLKSCPKCRGDVELTDDTNGDYVKCLMCGFTRYLPERSRNGDRFVAPPDIEALPRAG